MSRPLDARLVRGRRGFEDVAAEWEVLAARVDAPVFQRPAWLRAWFEHLAPSAEPWLLASGEPLRALLPLSFARRNGLRVLELAGQGVSDYLGPLADTPDAGAPLMAALEEACRGVDLIDLRGLADDPVALAFARAVRRPHAQRRYEPCPAIDTSGTWEAYLAERRKKFRANLKRADRRTREHGEPRVEQVVGTESLFEEMVEVERASWKWEGGFATLRDPARQRFVRHVLLDPSVTQQLWTVRLGEDLAAFAWLFPTDRAWHYYLPSFKAQYNDVGTFLLAELVQACFASPSREFDFLQGDESYKRPWATHEHRVDQLTISGRGLGGRAALLATRARWKMAESERLKTWRGAALTRLQSWRK